MTLFSCRSDKRRVGQSDKLWVALLTVAKNSRHQINMIFYPKNPSLSNYDFDLKFIENCFSSVLLAIKLTVYLSLYLMLCRSLV